MGRDFSRTSFTVNLLTVLSHRPIHHGDIIPFVVEGSRRDHLEQLIHDNFSFNWTVQILLHPSGKSMKIGIESTRKVGKYLLYGKILLSVAQF